MGIECQIADGQGEQLNRLLAGYFDRVKQALEMQLPDGPSSDRHAWAAAAGEHGRALYSDDDNSVDIQQQRLVRFQHLAQREIDAGWQPLVVKFHDFLNALAITKKCKQPGSDCVVVQMVRAPSWSTLCISCSWYDWVAGRLRDLMLGLRWF